MMGMYLSGYYDMLPYAPDPWRFTKDPLAGLSTSNMVKKIAEHIDDPSIDDALYYYMWNLPKWAHADWRPSADDYWSIARHRRRWCEPGWSPVSQPPSKGAVAAARRRRHDAIEHPENYSSAGLLCLATYISMVAASYTRQGRYFAHPKEGRDGRTKMVSGERANQVMERWCHDVERLSRGRRRLLVHAIDAYWSFGGSLTCITDIIQCHRTARDEQHPGVVIHNWIVQQVLVRSSWRADNQGILSKWEKENGWRLKTA